LNLIKILLIA